MATRASPWAMRRSSSPAPCSKAADDASGSESFISESEIRRPAAAVKEEVVHPAATGERTHVSAQVQEVGARFGRALNKGTARAGCVNAVYSNTSQRCRKAA